VLLIPGFLAGDQTLLTMQAWLLRLDYRPELSGIRFNVRHSEVTVEAVLERLYVHHRKTKQKVALVGHSRGGLLAKVIADRNPELVSQVIALGSPLNEALDVHPLTMAAVHAARIYNRLRYRSQADTEAAFMEQLAAPPAVPVTSIYTRSDGVVNWKACLRPDVKAIEVRGSHGGLGVNAEVYPPPGPAAAPLELMGFGSRPGSSHGPSWLALLVQTGRVGWSKLVKDRVTRISLGL